MTPLPLAPVPMTASSPDEAMRWLAAALAPHLVPYLIAHLAQTPEPPAETSVDPAELLTVREVAAMLKISVQRVYQLSSAGRLRPDVKIGRSVRWRRSTVDAFLAASGDSPVARARRARAA